MLPTPELNIAKSLPRENCSLAEAQNYTRRLATHHYENFHVASWLLPRHLRQHFYNVYAYSRWSDDLGDEIADPRRSLLLLDSWEADLRAIYEPGASAPAHPVLIALRETILEKEIPVEPFVNLLRAFRQDQTVRRYATWDSVYEYSSYSANPVGQLVLYLCGYRDEWRQRLSDFTCTALQFTNFWQDVSRDLPRGRVYIPIEELTVHGLTVQDIVERRFDERYVGLMKAVIARTRGLYKAGFPLAKSVDADIRVDIELFTRGGMAILDAIENCGYNTLQSRPSLSKTTKLGLVANAFMGKVLPSGSAAPANPAPPARSSTHAPSAAGSGAPIAKDAEDLIAASYSECNRIARASKSSFYLAFFGLPKPKRNALCALYAFMRLVDDVSDEPGGLDAKCAGLARWRNLLDEAVAGRTAAHPILPALADTMSRYQMPARYFHDLILGAEMDLTIKSYATFDRLSEYCYRVAGTVGLTCLHVFEFRDPHAPDLAERLGLAFQLTNIIRDVRGDFDMGRVYLPEEDLARFGLRADDLRGPLTPRLRDLLAFEADRAWRLYEEGAPLVQLVNSDSRATLWALVRTYSTLLARIEEDGFDVFSSRVSLSSAEKIQYLVAAGMSGWWKRDALAKRSGDRRRPGRDVLRRRAG